MKGLTQIIVILISIMMAACSDSTPQQPKETEVFEGIDAIQSNLNKKIMVISQTESPAEGIYQSAILSLHTNKEVMGITSALNAGLMNLDILKSVDETGFYQKFKSALKIEIQQMTNTTKETYLRIVENNSNQYVDLEKLLEEHYGENWQNMFN
jgi:hypothetical protein